MRHLGLVLSSFAVSTLFAAGTLAVGCSSSTESSPSSGGADASTNPVDGGGGNDGAAPDESEGTIYYLKDKKVYRAKILEGATPTELPLPDVGIGNITADGARLLLPQDVSGENRNKIISAAADGSDPKDVLLPPIDTYFSHPIPGADGNVYVVNRTARAILSAPIAGGTPAKIAGMPDTKCMVDWIAGSRDKTKIAFYVKAQDGEGDCADNDHGFYVIPNGSTSPAPLLRPPGVIATTVSAYTVTFMPAGDEIAFVASDSGPVIKAMKLDGSEARGVVRLPNSVLPQDVQGLAISKDGKDAYVEIFKVGIRRISIDPPGTELETIPGVTTELVGGMILVD